MKNISIRIVFGLSLVLLVPKAFAAAASETLYSEPGVFRIISAETLQKESYHIKASFEYTKQDGLLKDADESEILNSNARVGAGFALFEWLHFSGYAALKLVKRTPQGTTTGSADIADLPNGGLGVTASYDLGAKSLGLLPKKLIIGGSLAFDIAEAKRIFKNPNIIPTFIMSSDFSDSTAFPFKAHLNLRYRMANSSRYFKTTEGINDFDRYATGTFDSQSVQGGLAFEFPYNRVNPVLEAHVIKSFESDFSKTPKWITLGIKGNPFPTQNVEFFGGLDIGLSKYKATAVGSTADVPATPSWNALLGFTVKQFGVKETQVVVERNEYDGMKKDISDQKNLIAGLNFDLEYNTVQGRVIDAETKRPLERVAISFPELARLKTTQTTSDGRFIRYFKDLSGARMVFSADGYESSSKFLSLRPGERLNMDVELIKAQVGREVSEFAATVTDESGQPLTATIILTRVDTGAAVTGLCDRNGSVSLKVAPGQYRLDVQAEGFQTRTDMLTFEVNKAVVRSVTLSK